jgi:hypothetical protein
MSKNLKNITLIGIDCLAIERLKLAADISERGIEFGAVKLLTSIPDSDPRVVRIDPITSIQEYSRFCIQDLAKYVDTDFALVIQHDGFILNPDAWTDEFLGYDYIGAPWWYMDDMNVGNGGFSLRSKKLLNLLQGADFITEFHPEDRTIARTYSKKLKENGIQYAPQSLAEKFSIEGASREEKIDADNTWNGQFGFHDLNATDISKWLEQHPEYSSIKNVLEEKYRR